MARKVFSGHNDYQGLEEALQAIFNEESDIGEVDLVALPPKPSVVTDEEEGNDDNIRSNVIPRDIPGRVEVFTNRNNEDWDSSDDEIFTEIKKRRSNLQEPRWRKIDPTYERIASNESNLQVCLDKLTEELKNQTPLFVFEKIR